MEEKKKMGYDLISIITGTSLNRIGRAKFITRSAIFSIAISVIEFAIFWIATLLEQSSSDLIMPILLVPLLVFAVYGTVYLNNKRFHDRGLSGWWQLLMLIPVVNVIVTLYLWLAPGNKGENKYGLQAETKTRETVVAWCLFAVAIVLIGIFVIASFPRMQSAQNYAKDATRKLDLSHVESALIANYSVKGEFPKMNEAVNGLTLSAIKDDLNYAGLEVVPTDPISSSKNSGLGTATSNGEYLYMVSKKNSVPNGGFVLMAKTESANSSNWVVCENGEGIIVGGTDLGDIKKCESIVKGDSCSNYNGNCTYTDNSQLRYLLIW